MLFAPRSGALIVELAAGSAFPKGAVKVGTTIPDPVFVLGGQRMLLADLTAAWSGTLEDVFPSHEAEVPVSREIPLYKTRNEAVPVVKAVNRVCLFPYFRERTVSMTARKLLNVQVHRRMCWL